MHYGETIAWILVTLLAVYGCAQLIRRLCLWLTRCPGCAVCCRVAIPRNGAALAPLIRCLQSQAVWDEAYRHTLVVLPPPDEEQERQLAILAREAPAVTPVTPAQLYAMLMQLVAEDTIKQDDKGKE